MKTYNISRLPSIICLGYDGENNWRPQAFDCTPLLQNHPNGTITLWILPDGETQAFPVALTRDGNTVVWTPLSEEMTERTGALQIVCTDGTDVGKSAVVLFRVDESILPGAEHPAAVPSWATQTIERAEAAADRAEEAAEGIDIAAIEAMIAQAVEGYLEEHPIEAPVQSVNGKTGTVVLDASDVGALPDDTPIPAAVTEQTVAGWGFTKNTGTYSKPSGGIPDSDIASAATWNAKGTYSKPSGGIPASDLASAVQTSLGKADTALQTAPVTSVNNKTGAVTIPIPTVPTMATDPNMSDWTSGKTVDAAALKTDLEMFDGVLRDIYGVLDHKASVSDIPTAVSELTNDSGYQTAQDVQTAISGVRQLPAVTASDNGKFLRVVNGAWAAETVQTWQGGSY